jgi:hypothetical protein
VLGLGPDGRHRIATGLEKTWSALLYVIPAAVCFFAIYVVQNARTNSAAIGDRATYEISEGTARAIDEYIMHAAIELRAVATIPDLVRLTAEGAAQARRRPEYARMEDYLSRLASARGTIFRELIVADRAGQLVVASGRTEDTDQSDESWWQQGLRLPLACEVQALPTCAHGDDVVVDASVGGRGAALAVPIFEAGIAIGVLKSVIDPREIDGLLALAAAKHPIDVRLIRRDGSNVLTEQRIGAAGSNDAFVPAQQGAIEVEGRHFTTRALAGPHGGLWAVAIGDRSERRANSFQLVALAGVVLVMFLVSARAYALLFHRRA